MLGWMIWHIINTIHFTRLSLDADSWRQSPGLQQRQLIKSNINWPSMSTAGCRHSAVQFDMFYALLQWLKQTTNRVLTHKRYPISHPHGRAMWWPLWGFWENWPPYNGSTLHCDLRWWSVPLSPRKQNVCTWIIQFTWRWHWSTT